LSGIVAFAYIAKAKAMNWPYAWSQLKHLIHMKLFARNLSEGDGLVELKERLLAVKEDPLYYLPSLHTVQNSTSAKQLPPSSSSSLGPTPSSGNSPSIKVSYPSGLQQPHQQHQQQQQAISDSFSSTTSNNNGHSNSGNNLLGGTSSTGSFTKRPRSFKHTFMENDAALNNNNNNEHMQVNSTIEMQDNSGDTDQPLVLLVDDNNEEQHTSATGHVNNHAAVSHTNNNNNNNNNITTNTLQMSISESASVSNTFMEQQQSYAAAYSISNASSVSALDPTQPSNSYHQLRHGKAFEYANVCSFTFVYWFPSWFFEFIWMFVFYYLTYMAAATLTRFLWSSILLFTLYPDQVQTYLYIFSVLLTLYRFWNELNEPYETIRAWILSNRGSFPLEWLPRHNTRMLKMTPMQRNDRKKTSLTGDYIRPLTTELFLEVCKATNVGYLLRMTVVRLLVTMVVLCMFYLATTIFVPLSGSAETLLRVLASSLLPFIPQLMNSLSNISKDNSALASIFQSRIKASLRMLERYNKPKNLPADMELRFVLLSSKVPRAPDRQLELSADEVELVNAANNKTA